MPMDRPDSKELRQALRSLSKETFMLGVKFTLDTILGAKCTCSPIRGIHANFCAETVRKQIIELAERQWSLQMRNSLTAEARPRKTPQALAAQLNETRKALRELLEISGEAHIELSNSHAVRKLAKFIKTREKAQRILES